MTIIHTDDVSWVMFYNSTHQKSEPSKNQTLEDKKKS